MQIEPLLVHLESSDLVRRLSEPDVSYFFKHALVQDTASASLLHQERRRLHRLVGEALETVYAGSVEDFFVLLAQHFEIAGEDAKTLEYAMQAGEAALRTSALPEALDHFTRALKAAQRADLDTTEAFLKRGRVLEVQDLYPEALKNYAMMLAYAEAKNLPRLKLAALMATATLHSIPSVVFDTALAASLTKQALELAQKVGDKPAEAKILWNRLLALSRADVRYREAVESGERALEIARTEHLTELTAYLLNDLSPILGFLGQAERAEKYNLEARAMWREMNNLPMLSDNLGYAVMNYLMQSEYQAAIQASQEALQISRETDNRWGEAFAQTWIGPAYMESGEIAVAIEAMENTIELAKQSFSAPLVLTRGDLSRLYSEMGAPERALPLAEAALEKARATFVSMLGDAQGALALAHLRSGNPEAAFQAVSDVSLEFGDETPPIYQWDRVRVRLELMIADLGAAENELATARRVCENVLEHLRTHHNQKFYMTFLLLNARICLAAGDLAEAEEILSSARDLCLEKNAQWSLWQALALLAQVQARRGNAAEAENYRTAARTRIESIAARTPEHLRAGFLKMALSRL